MSTIGIVVPTYKEAGNIAALLAEIRGQVPDAWIIVVDDTPDESTVDAVAAVRDPKVEAVHRSTKDGRGSAVLEGVRRLLPRDTDRIIEMDADFSHPPAQIPELLGLSRSRELDLVIASRYLPESRILNWPLSRRAFSKFANALARTLLRVPITDYTNGYRVYSHRAAEVIVETCGRLGRGFIPLSEILVNLYYRGFTVGETPTEFVNRARGESSVNLAEITNAARGLFLIYGLKRRLQKDAGRTT
jgi:dolichol-phosphate mannosyltransferase